MTSVQKREPDSRKRTAVHEAAHAVAAKAYGLTIRFAEVYTGPNDKGNLGRVVHAKATRWANTVISIAGPQGELAFYNNEWGSDHDFEQAHRSARQFDRGNSTEVVREAKTAAQKIVRDNLAVIFHLAAALECRGKLSGAEIDGIIGKVRPGPVAKKTPIERMRRDAARRRARGDHEGADFIEKWIRQQETPR
jgi:hypothetical protein